MHPILIEWRWLRIASYPAFLYLGLNAGVVAGNIAAHRSGLDAFRVFVAMILLLIPALAGARLLFVASHWRVYRREPRRIWRRSEGGMAMYGGVPLMIVCSVPLLRVLRVPFAAFWDVASFTILTGMAFTRVGCLLNGCCAGRRSSSWLAVRLPNHRGEWASRLPTQVFEGASALALLVVSMAAWPHLPFSGALFLVVVAGYGATRLLLESTRESDAPSRGLTIDRAISGSLAAVALSLLAARWSM